ncbi:MAG: CHASE domain-containing protein, partial [Acidobacteria bacterium]|nr:CHASE domain-containing protein [Acidobacteriota bacterium]
AKALRSGRPAVTGRVHLVQEDVDTSGILVVQPVRSLISGHEAGSSEELPPAGFMVGAYRVGDLVRAALHDSLSREFDIRLVDLDGRPGEQVLFDEGSTGPQPPGNEGRSHGSAFSRELDLPERTWRLDLRPRERVNPWRCCSTFWLTFFAGLLMTGILCWYLESIRRSDLRLHRTIRNLRATELELFEEKERAQVTLRSIADGVVTTNPTGHIQFMNPVAERMTGWALSEAQGRVLCDVVRIIDEESREPVRDLVAFCQSEVRPTSLLQAAVLLGRHGREYAVRESVAPIHDLGGEFKGVALVLHDATDNRRMVREMAHRASHDALTGLVNRREFEHRLLELLDDATENDSLHALCYLDLDHFKIVNDTA